MAHLLMKYTTYKITTNIKHGKGKAPGLFRSPERCVINVYYKSLLIDVITTSTLTAPSPGGSLLSRGDSGSPDH